MDDEDFTSSNMPFVKMVSPVVFISSVVLMEVLNVVVDQNRTFNPEKRIGILQKSNWYISNNICIRYID